MINKLVEISNLLKSTNNILIGSHINPDGDNLGSSLGLYRALKKMGKNVHVLWVDDIPKDYLFLPGVEDIIKFEELDILDYTFIALDSADMERLDINKVIAENAKELINIDHHLSNPSYGDYAYIDTNSSSTGELVYDLIKELEVEVDKEIASCIYTAISTDTGSFRYSNTRGKTHSIIAELYKTDFNASAINIKLYQNNSLARTKLHSLVINNLETYCNNKVAVSIVNKDLLNSTNSLMEDSEGLVEKLRDIEGVEVSILIKEYEDFLRVSIRSKEYVDVSKVCIKYGGGGHKRAAGCTIELNNNTINHVKKDLIKEVGKFI